MAKKSLKMMGKMMDLNIIDYFIIKCAIQSIITIENGYQIDFGKPECSFFVVLPKSYQKPSAKKNVMARISNGFCADSWASQRQNKGNARPFEGQQKTNKDI